MPFRYNPFTQKLDWVELTISGMDDRYVNVTGDTMTGALVIDPSSDAVALTVQTGTGLSNIFVAQNAAGSTNYFVVSSGGQVQMPQALSAGTGLLLGTDAEWYRGAADTLQTPDNVRIDQNVAIGTSINSMRKLQISATHSTDASLIGTYASITITGAIGGSSFPEGARFELNTSSSSTVQNMTGGVFLARVNPANNGSVNNCTGGSFLAWHNTTASTTTSTLTGGTFEAKVQSASAAGTITNCVAGLFSTIHSNASVNITNAYNLRTRFAKTAGTITNQYLIYLDPVEGSGSGTITNLYGLYISDQSSGTNNYGIYFAGTSGLARQGVHWNGDTNIFRQAAGVLEITSSLRLPGTLRFVNGASVGTVQMTPTGARTVTIQDATHTLVGQDTTDTLTNKRITKRSSVTNAPGATPTTNTDTTDIRLFTGLNAAITSMTTNLSGTPTEGQTMWFAFTDDGTARAITWGSSFEASGTVALPTTTVISTRLDVGFVWNTVTSKWRCVAVA